MLPEERKKFEKQVKALVESGPVGAMTIAEFFWKAGREYEHGNHVPPDFNPHNQQQLSDLLQLAAGTANAWEQHHHGYGTKSVMDMDGLVPHPYPWPEIDFKFSTENLFYFVQKVLARFSGF